MHQKQQGRYLSGDKSHINPVDYKVRATVPADDAWKVIGWDASGIIKEVGADVTLLRLAMKSGMQAISLVKGLMHNTKL
jgi:NADPH:quinone reductase-like Zn-dependent oxidoreductase